MFFPGVDGLTAFFPDKVLDNSYIPPIVLTDFRLFNETVLVGGHSPLKKAISYTDALELSHEQAIFSFEFSALSYIAPGPIDIGTSWRDWKRVERSNERAPVCDVYDPPAGRICLPRAGQQQPRYLERTRSKCPPPNSAPVVEHLVVQGNLRRS